MAGQLIVSLDFELFWGMLDCSTLESYGNNVMGGRSAIPRLLEVFKKYDIHATWATVGFLFGENYEDLQRFFPEKSLRPSYADPRLDPYGWFETIGKNEQDAPCFYGPGLVRMVADTPGQEIGSHTFCHYYCREKGQTVEQFEADLHAAKAIALDKGYELTSIILPRNQCKPEYTAIMRKCGFTAYRDEENDWIHEKIKYFPLLRLLRLVDAYVPLTGQGGYVPACEEGIWNLIGSRAFKAVSRSRKPLEGLKLRRIKRQMLHAAKKGLTFHLWWHPHNMGDLTEEFFAQLEDVLQYYTQLREEYGMESLTMREAAEKAQRQQAHIAEKYGLQHKKD